MKKFIILLACGLGTIACSCAQTGWQQSSDTWSTTPYSVKVYELDNPGPGWMTANGSGNDVWENSITGSSTENPPTWGSHYTPLGDSETSVAWGVYQAVAPLYLVKLTLNWSIGSGTQTFDYWSNGVDTGMQISRESSIGSYVSPDLVYVQYIFDNGNGGSGG